MEVIEYNTKYKEGALKIYTEVLGIDLETSEKDLEHHSKSETSKVFVAKEDDNILGLVTFYWQKWNMTGHIGVIGVSPSAQGKGVGKALCNKVFQFAKNIKIRKVYVDTSIENINAQIFYIKTGFKFEHIMKDYYKEGEDGVMFAIKI
jgi:ribosomal protein S18 acetylase RimI-like enzyme